MNLPSTDKGRGGGKVAANTVGRGRRCGNIFLDPGGGMVVAVSVEVRHMTLGASAAFAIIDTGITMAIDPDAT